MASSELALRDQGPVSQRSRPVAGTAYNEAMPWAYRLTWDRGAFELAHPEFTFGRAISREQVELVSASLTRFQTTERAPLLAVSVWEPGGSDWVVVWRWPLQGES